MKYRFRAAKSFRRALARLALKEKRLAAAAFKIFKQNPFDPRVRAAGRGGGRPAINDQPSTISSLELLVHDLDLFVDYFSCESHR